MPSKPQAEGRPSGTARNETGPNWETERQKLLFEFCRALGGQPTDRAALPFTPDTVASEGVYVYHDERLHRQVPNWLAAGDHVGLCSEHGTGKTAFCDRLASELGESDGVLVATVTGESDPTPRRLSESLLRAAHRAGCGVDPENYWQVDQGVPWQTDEVNQALWEVTANVRETGRQLVLAVDDCQHLSPRACDQLTQTAHSGVQLLLLGTDTAQPVVEELSGDLSGTLRYLDGIDSFDPATTRQFVSATLTQCGADHSRELFSDDAIRYIVAETGGNPRAVRQLCLDLFGRAAVLWAELDVPADRVTITPAIAERDGLRPV